MNRQAPGQNAAEVAILLVGLPPEECEALLQGPLASDPHFHFWVASTPAEVLSEVEAREVDAIICDFTAFAALRAALPEAARGAGPTPTLVLVGSGGEERAAALLESDGTDVLLRLGNYPLLVVAWLHRALHRREGYSEELGRIIRHEFNNPLTGVLGNAELILVHNTPLPQEVHQRLRTIVDLAVRMRDVLRSLERRLRRHNTLLNGPQRAEPLEPQPLSREAR